MSIFDKQIYRPKRCKTCNARHDSTEYATCNCHAGQTMTPRGDRARIVERGRIARRDEALRETVERSKRR